jgi:hypothetical protein
MTLHPRHGHAALLATLLALAGCGGGGGGGSVDPAPSYPASGPFGWILKAAGPTTALKYGLSLVHPSQPGTEYVIEYASAVVSDARLVSGGTVDASNLRATSIQPHALVYIVGGDVRSVPMQADGSAPLSRVQRSGSTSACKFILDANDYATPQNSRFIVSTAGADGQCDASGGGDDGRAEVQLSATGGLSYTPLAADKPLGVVRDPATLAPRGWIYPRSVVLWTTSSPATTFSTRADTDLAVTSVLASTHQSALVEDGTKLSVLSFSGGTAVIESQLDPALASGSGWQSIGFDANNFYVYDNAGDSFSSTWKVLKISRSNPTASLLATGTGLVSLASMGRDVLYLTVATATDNRLVRINKAGGTPVETVSPITTFTQVQTSASGVHQRWRVTDVGSASPTYTIDIIDESDTTLHTVAGGFPMTLPQASSQNFNTSESRTRFVFAGNYGARTYGDASLLSYDAATSAPPRLLGTLPGTAIYGNDFVFASVIAGPTPLGLGFAARSSNGSILEAGARVFSYDLDSANSLTYTTTTR